MKDGHVLMRTSNILLLGLAGAGKTCTKHLIFNRPPPKQRNSTGVADSGDPLLLRKIRDPSRSTAQIGKEAWEPVATKALIQYIACHIQWFNKDDTKLPENLDSTLEDYLSDSVSCRGFPTLNEISTVTNPEDAPTEELNEDESSNIASLMEKAIGEIHSFLESGNHEEVGSNWISLIDSGGQPHFHNILPLFVRDISAALYVLRLSDTLNYCPEIGYFMDGELQAPTFTSPFSIKDNFKFLIQSVLSHSKNCKLVIIGTHHDKIKDQNETLQYKNDCLYELLPQNVRERTKIYKASEKSVIYPINAVTCDPEYESERKRIVSLILKAIQPNAGEQYPLEIPVPIRWYVFLFILMKIAEHSKSIVNIQQCRAAANLSNISENEIQRALKFFQKHLILHYYPDILPGVVFCDTQIIFEIITKLVEYAAGYRRGEPIENVDGEWMDFLNKGTFKESLLDKLLHKDFNHHFGPKELIVMLEYLLLAVKINDLSKSGTRYYMPSLLRLKSAEELKSERATLIQDNKLIPLVVKFENGWPCCGIFTSLQVFLIKKLGWNFTKDEKLINLNVVKMLHTMLSCSIILIDSLTHIEVYILKSSIEPLPPYFRIGKEIAEGIVAACKTLHYDDETPQVAFLCPDSELFKVGVISQTVPESSQLVEQHLANVSPELDPTFMRCPNTEDCHSLEASHKQWIKGFRSGKSLHFNSNFFHA